MKPSLVSKALDVALRAKRPVILKGQPGLGKSSLVKQCADRHSISLIDMRLPQLDAVDVRGLPYVSNGKALFAQPGFLPTEGAGILFLDELPQAPVLVQNAASELLLDRRLGDYRLPDEWVVFAAGNNRADRAGVTDMPTHIRSRLIKLDVEADITDWADWALGASIMPEIIAFLRYRSDLLHQFNKDADVFPCPRTWEFANDILKANPSEDVKLPLLAGCVGEGASAEFIGFLRVFKELPDPALIFASPETAQVPSGPAVLYALSGLLARLAKRENVDALVKYLNRLPQEFAVLTMRDASKRNPDIQSTPAFIEWTSRNTIT